jgi:F-type H+-transporting ATPase subunit b
MDLVTPGIGLIFWQTLTFLLVLFFLAKFAWKPIIGGLREREASIEDALSQAEQAKLEMQKLQAQTQDQLAEARSERDRILKEAQTAGTQLIEAAKQKATAEGNRMIESARQAINNEKNAALTEVKNLVGTLSIDIAERLIKQQLKDEAAQRDLVQQYLKETNLN